PELLKLLPMDDIRNYLGIERAGEGAVRRQLLASSRSNELPERLIGDKAYDADKLDARFGDERRVKLIALHHRGARRRPRTGGNYAATSAAGRWSASLPGSRTSAGW